MSVGPPTTDVSRATPDDNSCGSGIPLVLQLLHCHHVAVGVLVLLVVLFLPQLQHLECCKEERRGGEPAHRLPAGNDPATSVCRPVTIGRRGREALVGRQASNGCREECCGLTSWHRNGKPTLARLVDGPGLKMPLCRRCSKQVLTKQAFWAKIIGGQLPLGGGGNDCREFLQRTGWI